MECRRQNKDLQVRFNNRQDVNFSGSHHSVAEVRHKMQSGGGKTQDLELGIYEAQSRSTTAVEKRKIPSPNCSPYGKGPWGGHAIPLGGLACS